MLKLKSKRSRWWDKDDEDGESHHREDFHGMTKSLIVCPRWFFSGWVALSKATLVPKHKFLVHQGGTWTPIIVVRFSTGHIVAAVTGELWPHIVGAVTSWRVRGHVFFVFPLPASNPCFLFRLIFISPTHIHFIIPLPSNWCLYCNSFIIDI